MASNQEDNTNVIYQIAVRFGDPVLQDGFTSVPNLVLNSYAQLGISPAEMMFTIHVWQYWWTEKDPYPSLNAVAQKMAVTRRQVRNYVQSLKAKGYLQVNERQASGQGQITSEYDFSPLIVAIVALSSNGGSTPRKDSSEGGRKNPSEAPRKQSSPEEYSVQKYPLKKYSLSSKGKSSYLRERTALRFSKKKVLNQSNSASEAHVPEDPDLRRVPRAGEDPGGFKPISELLTLQQAQRLAQVATDAPEKVMGGQRRTKSKAPPATPYIEQLITDFSSELHDEEHTRQNISQAARLWQESGRSEQAFCQLLYEARSLTKQYRVKKKAKGEAGEFGLRNKMPYYFSVLKDLLGMKGERTASGPHAPPG